jgi:hypothetical protein
MASNSSHALKNDIDNFHFYFRMSDMSRKFPYINSQCEEYWNSNFLVFNIMKKLNRQSKILVDNERAKIFHQLTLGKFCIYPSCIECGKTSKECKHRCERCTTNKKECECETNAAR